MAASQDARVALLQQQHVDEMARMGAARRQLEERMSNLQERMQMMARDIAATHKRDRHIRSRYVAVWDKRMHWK